MASMILLGLLTSCPKEFLICRLLRITAAASIIWFTGNSYRPAHADTEDALIVDMPVNEQVISNSLVEQAEQLAVSTINQQFSQNSSLSEIKVMVMGNRYGEVIPVLTTSVSRTQWQAMPQISAWTQYYSASYALFQRHDLQENSRVARAPVNVPATPALVLSSQIDQAYDEGHLIGVEAQQYLDYL
ncbi:MAG TPA: hypothetical protein V6D29_23240 [Leptolyngbyaceae cyanobacterium]